MTSSPIDARPLVLTSFAAGDSYTVELGGLCESIRSVYPDRIPLTTIFGYVVDRRVVVIRDDRTDGTLALPEGFDLGSWWDVVALKAWWMYEIWRRLSPQELRRMLWLDADARLSRPLRHPVPESGEFLAAHWVSFPQRQTLHSGTVLVQGEEGGWSEGLLARAVELCRPGTREGHQAQLRRACLEWEQSQVPSPHEGTERSNSRHPPGSESTTLSDRKTGGRLLSLPDAYCSIVLRHGDRPAPDAVVEHWMAHRRRVDPSWPPSEEERHRLREV